MIFNYVSTNLFGNPEKVKIYYSFPLSAIYQQPDQSFQNLVLAGSQISNNVPGLPPQGKIRPFKFSPHYMIG